MISGADFQRREMGLQLLLKNFLNRLERRMGIMTGIFSSGAAIDGKILPGSRPGFTGCGSA
jgi:hypothetical protein